LDSEQDDPLEPSRSIGHTERLWIGIPHLPVRL
jgi:hypothetical protein